MGNETPAGAKIDRRIEAEPVLVGGMSVQPAARFVGWESTAKTGTSPAVGAVGRLTPLEIRIDNGEEQTILQIEDPLLQPIRGILAVSLAVSVACILIMLAAQIVASRK